MPVKDIQASAHIVAQFNNPLIAVNAQIPIDTITIAKHQNQITTAILPLPLKLILTATFFGSAPDSALPSPDTTSLDRGDKINLEIYLSRRAHSESDCLAQLLFKNIIDLSQKDPLCYFPADLSFQRPYYYYNTEILLPTLTFPDYGDYSIKFALCRGNIDQDFFVQSIAPFHVLPPKD